MNPLEKAKTRILAQDRWIGKNVDFLTIYPKAAEDMHQACLDIQNILNIDESKNLDLIGRHLVIPRNHEKIPLNSLSIGTKTARCGHKKAYCKAATWSDATDLSDKIYRLVLKSKVIINTSDCTIPDIEEALTEIVSSSRVIVDDRQDMTFRIIFVGRLTAIEKYAIDNYDIIPVPQGVTLIGYEQTALSPRLGKSFAVCGNNKARCRA